MEPRDEKQWVEHAKKDPDTFALLFNQFYNPILNYVLKRVSRLQVAQDITSEVFFLVHTKLWQFKWRNIPFSAWIYRIANREVAYYFRKNKQREVSLEKCLEAGHWEPQAEEDLEAEQREAERDLEAHEKFLSLQKSLLKLPIKYQEVLTLKYFENKKILEISQILGKRQGTVKSLLKRGRDLLKHEVEK